MSEMRAPPKEVYLQDVLNAVGRGECERPKEQTARYANCGRLHVAIYRDCEKFPRTKEALVTERREPALASTTKARLI